MNQGQGGGLFMVLEPFPLRKAEAPWHVLTQHSFRAMLELQEAGHTGLLFIHVDAVKAWRSHPMLLLTFSLALTHAFGAYSSQPLPGHSRSKPLLLPDPLERFSYPSLSSQ